MRVRSTVVHTPTPDSVELLDQMLITVDGDGTITSLEPDDGAGAVDVDLPPGQVLLPGFIDTHLHAPQWPNLGSGLDLPLERWLGEHTFPTEARFADVSFAQQVWDDMVPTLLSLGTTTAVYHSSIHREATRLLAETCVRFGQRALVGRVAMDHPDSCPEWYRDVSAEGGVAESAASIADIRALGSPLVEPIITPRFIPACSDELLVSLGKLAHESGVRVQTHCSESDWEHQVVLDRYGITDTAALSHFGLLREHTVLAHATHLTDDDAAMMIGIGAGTAHCPMSNSYFANAVFPAHRHLSAGMRVGLGTDVSGGPSPSMADQIAHAVTVSRMFRDGVDPHRAATRTESEISITAAVWMATAGGAALAGLPVGLFEVGRQFDAIAVAEPGVFGGETAGLDPAIRLERVVRALTRSRPDHVWVNGVDVTPG